MSQTPNNSPSPADPTKAFENPGSANPSPDSVLDALSRGELVEPDPTAVLGSMVRQDLGEAHAGSALDALARGELTRAQSADESASANEPAAAGSTQVVAAGTPAPSANGYAAPRPTTRHISAVQRANNAIAFRRFFIPLLAGMAVIMVVIAALCIKAVIMAPSKAGIALAVGIPSLLVAAVMVAGVVIFRRDIRQAEARAQRAEEARRRQFGL